MRPDQSVNSVAARLYYTKHTPIDYMREEIPMSPYQTYRYMYDKANGSPLNFNEIAYRMAEGPAHSLAGHELHPLQTASTNMWLRPHMQRVRALPSMIIQQMLQ